MLFAASLLSFCAGFLSLSLEVLWVRLFSYVNHSLPQSFAFVLIWFLLGVACGAQIGKSICQRQWINPSSLWFISAIILLSSALPDAIGPWLYAYFATTQYQLIVAAMIIFLVASFKAIIFPIAHHLGTPSSGTHIGRSLASVYSANILGCTLGPLCIGIFMLTWISTQQAFLFCAAVAAFCGICFLPALMIRTKVFVSFIIISVISTFALQNTHGLIAKVTNSIVPIRYIVEDPHGVVVVFDGGRTGDIVTGGNVYDGNTNLDPIVNSNHINRLLILPSIKPNPKRVLMIGLSIGSWLKLVTTFPHVEYIDVIEINPAYLQAIAQYPRQQNALNDSRVHLHINDARRWLKAHPNSQYDLVIMNTTFHWRVYVTNLVSIEFLQLIKSHMKPDAVLTYNTTGSPDIFKTAIQLFNYAYLYENFIIAADFDWRNLLQQADANECLAALQMDGKPLFPPGSDEVIRRFLNEKIFSFKEIEQYYKELDREIEVVSDKNLITEYKYGKHL